MNLIFEHWAFWALLSSFLFSGNALIIEFFSKSTKQVMIWRGVGTGLVMLPVLFFIDLEANYKFFLYLFVLSSLAIFADARIYRINREFGAGLKSRIAPSVVFFTFIFAFFSGQASLENYLDQPLWSAALIGILALTLFFALSLRRCDISKKAYLYALLPIIAYALCNIMAKESLSNANSPAGSLYYTLIQGWFMGVASTTFLRENDHDMDFNDKRHVLKRYIFNKQSVYLGLGLGLCIAASMVTRNLSFVYTDNISYPVALQLLTPFWVMLFYMFIKRKEEAKILPGVGIVCCAIALILIKGQIG